MQGGSIERWQGGSDLRYGRDDGTARGSKVKSGPGGLSDLVGRWLDSTQQGLHTQPNLTLGLNLKRHTDPGTVNHQALNGDEEGMEDNKKVTL